MRRIFTILVAFTLILSPISSGASIQKPPEDCLVCGHACCCPEVCAPLIKKMKEAKAAKHCGAEGPGSDVSCNQPDSICRIQSVPPMGFSGGRAETDWPNPQFTDLKEADVSAQRAKGALFDHCPLGSFSLALDVPTPPPRILPPS